MIRIGRKDVKENTFYLLYNPDINGINLEYIGLVYITGISNWGISNISIMFHEYSKITKKFEWDRLNIVTDRTTHPVFSVDGDEFFELTESELNYAMMELI